MTHWNMSGRAEASSAASIALSYVLYKSYSILYAVSGQRTRRIADGGLHCLPFGAPQTAGGPARTRNTLLAATRLPLTAPTPGY